ncbi:MAG TPA: SDR family NAD(P)-dependent oxidoreductase [Burkholderiales bacterium]
MSAQDLKGRVAIVSGGARGIGMAICEELIARGASVVVADSGVAINGDAPDAGVARAAAQKLGANAAAFSADVGAEEAGAAAVKLAQEKFGGVDIVVNNAAILKDGFIFKGNAQVYAQVLRNNLIGAYALTAAACAAMREQQKAGRVFDGLAGAVINIVSSAGIYGNFGQSAYASSKGGLMALTRITAMDMARSGVTANAIAPFAATRVTDSIIPANDAQAAYKERALKVPAKHVACFAAYLATPAAKGVSGQLFGVRGREVMLFSQPRPVATLVEPAGGWGDLAAQVQSEFASRFTDLKTDLESFNTDPLV